MPTKIPTNLSAMDIAEEAFLLLRGTGPGEWFTYLAGAVPFAAFLLFFVSEMAKGPDAYSTAALQALVLAASFLFFKASQARFAHGLMQRLRQGRPEKPTSVLLTVSRQARIQPWGFLAIPPAFLLGLPFGWVTAYFQNACVLSAERGLTLAALHRESVRLAKLWPAQNHLLLLITSVFQVLMFFNLFLAGLFVPGLLRNLTGVESVFTRNPGAYVNLTFFTGVLVATFLGIDPFVKAVYVLRCFYGRSLATGEDLLARWNEAVRAALVLSLLLVAVPCFAGTPAPSPASPVAGNAPHIGNDVSPIPIKSVRPEALDRSLDAVLKSPWFRWKGPKPPLPERAKGKRLEFLKNGIVDSIEWFDRRFGGFYRWLKEAWKKIFKDKKAEKEGPKVTPPVWNTEWLNVAAWVFIGAGMCVLAVLALRMARRTREAVLHAEAMAPAVPDLLDERISGLELPGEGWLQLARSLMARGEYRLALRAFFLAGLAMLSERHLLKLNPSKSTLDYARELSRSAHAFQGSSDAFHELGLRFDAGWYGDHGVTVEGLEGYAVLLGRLKTAVDGGQEGTP